MFGTGKAEREVLLLFEETGVSLGTLEMRRPWRDGEEFIVRVGAGEESSSHVHCESQARGRMFLDSRFPLILIR